MTLHLRIMSFVTSLKTMLLTKESLWTKEILDIDKEIFTPTDNLALITMFLVQRQLRSRVHVCLLQ